ncbi:MAG: methyltransferase domain-containing protein [Betaproteobacteria bacterium]|jgi:ubiquinone/menaquinone biosynthesis C-methylase UbiE|nr:MAG: methyltransferase domain-containing protein [Betaproteobacteria bacterium]
MAEHQDHLASVVTYYDTHPINEQQIMHALRARGIDLDHLTEDLLKDYDQDHFGGLQATDVLAAKAGIKKEHHVLDACSGMGGPARYIAHRIGCRVTGIDCTESRYLSAIKLSKLVGLETLVNFVHGDALDMPFEENSFDAVIAQEAWCHVPDKARLIAQCARVVKPGGVIAFTDILCTDKLSNGDMRRLRSEMTFPELETISGYARLLELSGCTLLEHDDLSNVWTKVLEDRLLMYRTLAEETERNFGAERAREWDDAYAFFVSRFRQGRLGGARFIARRDRGPVLEDAEEAL